MPQAGLLHKTRGTVSYPSRELSPKDRRGGDASAIESTEERLQAPLLPSGKCQGTLRGYVKRKTVYHPVCPQLPVRNFNTPDRAKVTRGNHVCCPEDALTMNVKDK